MDTPPPLPPEAKPPLGRWFHILMYAPIVIMGIAAAAAVFGGRNSDLQGFGMGVSMICLPVMLVCSIICAILVGTKRGAGIGVLTFLGIQVIYIGVGFAGCATVMSGVNFH